MAEEKQVSTKVFGWFVVHAQSGKEFISQEALKKRIEKDSFDAIKEVVVPVYYETIYKNGKKRKVKKKSFPGYLCVKMQLDAETKNYIRETPYVTGFLHQGLGDPIPLSDIEMESILSTGAEESAKPGSVQIDFDVGQKVLIVDGPFNNFSGSVKAVYPDKGKLNVSIEIFGRETPVEIDYYKVKKQ